MTDNTKLSGQCLCGTVRFAALPQNADMGVCHCSMCRRWTGGVFMAVSVGDSFEVTEGSDALKAYSSSEWGERAFCAECGTSLFWRHKESGHANISVQTLDNPSQFKFATEIFIDEKPGNYAFANDTLKMTAAEVYAFYAAKQDADNG